MGNEAGLTTKVISQVKNQKRRLAAGMIWTNDTRCRKIGHQKTRRTQAGERLGARFADGRIEKTTDGRIRLRRWRHFMYYFQEKHGEQNHNIDELEERNSCFEQIQPPDPFQRFFGWSMNLDI